GDQLARSMLATYNVLTDSDPIGGIVMQPPAPPEINAVEVSAAPLSEADGPAIDRLSAEKDRSLPFTVKVKLKTKPPVTSMAWALYVKDTLIPKYWEYEDGIYFTVLDAEFFSNHKGEPLRFSRDGVEFFDTGVKLPAPAASAVRAEIK